MTVNRINISKLMVLIALMALIFAALREHSPIWSSLLYSLALGGNFLAVVGVIVGASRTRNLATGYAVCGWGYLVLTLIQEFPRSQRLFLFASVLMDFVLDMMSPGLLRDDRYQVVLATDSLSIIASGSIGGVFAWYLSRRTSDMAPPTLPNTDQP